MSVGKFFKKVLLWLLTGGVILSVGFLSFAGMLQILPVLFYAVAVFFLSGVIEGQVYKENIFEAFKQPFRHSSLKRKIIINSLEKELSVKLENKGEISLAGRLEEYKNLKMAIAKFPAKKKLTIKQKSDLVKKKKDLKTLQHALVQDLLNTNYTPNDNEKELFEGLKKKLPSFSFQATLVLLSWPINIIGSIGTGLMTAYAMGEALALLGSVFQFTLPFVAVSVIVWPLAIIAAAGYVFILYHTISDLVTTGKLQHWWLSLKERLERRGDESLAKVAMRRAAVISLAVVAIGLGIFVTIATAGTCWAALDKLPNVLTHLTFIIGWLKNTFVPVITGLLVYGVGVTQAIFNISNSIDTVVQLAKTTRDSFLKPFKKIKGKLYKVWSAENKAQFFNPFRIMVKVIEIPLKVIMFLGHLVSIGLTSDQLGKLDSRITAAGTAISEGFQDFTYFAPEDKKKHKGIVNPFKDSSGHHHDHGENLLDFFIGKVMLGPLKIVAAVWDWGFSQLNLNKKDKINFKQALKRNFGVSAHRDILDKEIIDIKNDEDRKAVIKRIDCEIVRLESTTKNKPLAIVKTEVLYKVRDAVASGKEVELSKDDEQKLSVHRHGFFTKRGVQNQAKTSSNIRETRAKKFMGKLQASLIRNRA